MGLPPKRKPFNKTRGSTESVNAMLNLHDIDDLILRARRAYVRRYGANAPIPGDAHKGGDAAGSEREITLKGGVLKEGLDEYDPAAFKLSYRMSDPNLDAMPASSYSVTLSVKPIAGGSEVSWYGRLYRGDTSNEPPENLNDDAARTSMSEFLHNGLQGLKKKVEGK